MMNESPDLVGRRVRIAPVDHPHHMRVGTVIDQEPCEYCTEAAGREACGFDDLIVALDNGHTTRVYEPEADVV